MNKVFVTGVGMTKFIKPSQDNPDYPLMVKQAASRALSDSLITYPQVQAAVTGYVYGDSTCGQRALYQLGYTGIPIFNTNNNCATGSSSLQLGKQFVQSGIYDIVLVVGFDKMQKGSFKINYTDRANPLGKLIQRSKQIAKFDDKYPLAPQLFANAGCQHIQRHGTYPYSFAKIAQKNHRHSVNNPYSQSRKAYTLSQIMRSMLIKFPLTKLQCCPTSDGAGAAVLMSEKKMKQLGLEQQSVQILAMQMSTDTQDCYQSALQLVGYHMTKMTAARALKKAGLKIQDIGVIELHDCFSSNQLITYQALGLVKEGQSWKMIEKGFGTYGSEVSKVIINPSGGLIAKGHPLGATGLAQCAEICWQLRGLAQKRQVQGVQYGLQHNLGLGGACVIGIYRRDSRKKSRGTSNPDKLEEIEQAGSAKL